MSLFTDLDRLRADLDTLRPLAPEQEARVLQKFRLEWNYNSNAIEGNSLTLGETRSLLLHGLTAEGKPLRDHLDIKGHDEAVRGLEEIVHDDRPLTEQFIREMHQVLLGDEHYKAATTATGQPTRQRIVPGQYKTSANNVRTATGETFYFATPEETPAKMHDLLTWYRQEVEAPTLHPVALAAEFHHCFVSIHPFDDGNGRMSRLLMNLILLRHGYPMTVIKADDRNRYLAALSEADAGEPAPFLRFIIENVEASLRLMIRAARGESIDEPSDLDKKLALLRKQVLSKQEFIATTWNTTTQLNLYNSLLSFWITDFSTLMSNFNEFFENHGAGFHYRSGNSEITHSQQASLSTLLEASREIFEAINAPDTIKLAIFLFEWGFFRGIKNSFGQRVNLNFSFEERKFEVTFAVYAANDSGFSHRAFTSVYKAEYNQAQIHEINHQLANKVVDFISAKLAEADTPPA